MIAAQESGFLVATIVVTVVAAARGVWSPCGLSMISAINPITERSRGHRYWLTACWFIAGSVLGGSVLGGAAALGAWLVGALVAEFATTVVLVAAICALVALASDTALFGFRLPDHPRQVNERWLGRYRRWVYAAGFGVQIGCGFATYIMTAGVYLVAALAVLSGSPTVALGVGILFGLVRGSAVLLSAAATDPAGLRRLHHRLDLLGPWSIRLMLAVEVLAAATLAGLGVGPAGVFGVAVVVAGLGGAAVVARSGRQSARPVSRDTEATAASHS